MGVKEDNRGIVACQIWVYIYSLIIQIVMNLTLFRNWITLELNISAKAVNTYNKQTNT